MHYSLWVLTRWYGYNRTQVKLELHSNLANELFESLRMWLSIKQMPYKSQWDYGYFSKGHLIGLTTSPSVMILSQVWLDPWWKAKDQLRTGKANQMKSWGPSLN